MSARAPCVKHMPSADPRREGRCLRCGRPAAVKRDLEQERNWTVQATAAWHIEVDTLIAFSERRADNGGIRNLEARDFRQETLEELADARNYLVWRIRQLLMFSDEPGLELQRASEALRATALAFAALTS